MRAGIRQKRRCCDDRCCFAAARDVQRRSVTVDPLLDDLAALDVEFVDAPAAPFASILLWLA
jgi:hypothetical protein